MLTGVPMETAIRVPTLQVRAAVVPSTYNPSTHTVEIVWSTGSRTLVSPFFDEPFIEELGLLPDEVRLERFRSGAPLLDSHGEPVFRVGGSGLKDVLGVVRSAEVNGTEGRAVVEISQRPEVLSRGIELDVRAGILGNFSIGYKVHRYRDITQPDDSVRVLRAIDWEPFEVSLLPIPDDAGTRTRSAPELHHCVLEDADEGPAMAKKTKKKTRRQRRVEASTPARHRSPVLAPPVDDVDVDDDQVDDDDDVAGESVDDRHRAGGGNGGTPPIEHDDDDHVDNDQDDDAGTGGARHRAPTVPITLTPAELDLAVSRGVQQDRARVSGVALAFRAGFLGDENDADKLIAEHVASGTSLDQVRTLALDMISKHQDAAPTRSSISVGEEEGTKRYRGMQLALEHRVSAIDKLPEEGQAFRGMSLLRMAEEVLAVRGISARGFAPNELALRALSTSDFPQILADVANKVLARAYDTDDRTFTAWARRSEIPDFKPKNIVQLGSTALKEVSETGEITVGTIGDKGESYVLATYARRLPFTRKSIVNDDAGAFDRIPRMFGQAAARTESDIIYALVKNNGVLNEDGVAIFDAAHGNDDTNALALTALTTGRAKMRKQTDLDGQRINVRPQFLIVNPDLETIAFQLTTQVQPAASGDVNPFQSFFSGVIVEARLTSATEWYMASSPDSIDTIEYAFLRGDSGPRIERMDGFETDGTQWRVVHDFGAGVLDFRGLYRGNV